MTHFFIQQLLEWCKNHLNRSSYMKIIPPTIGASLLATIILSRWDMWTYLHLDHGKSQEQNFIDGLNFHALSNKIFHFSFSFLNDSYKFYTIKLFYATNHQNFIESIYNCYKYEYFKINMANQFKHLVDLPKIIQFEINFHT